MGEYRSVFKGQGMEFSEVREYQPGDEVRSIDWNVTARMGHPYVKRKGSFLPAVCCGVGSKMCESSRGSP